VAFVLYLLQKISHLISKQISSQNQNSRFVFTKQRTSQQWVSFFFSFFSFFFACQFCDVSKWNHPWEDLAKFGYKLNMKKKKHHSLFLATLLEACIAI
jgi:cell division protein FtsW (lipid II flippase)